MTRKAFYGCSSAGDSIGYVVRVWGVDLQGHQVNSLLPCAARDPGITSQPSFTFYTLKAARCAAAEALFALGARAHFWITYKKDKALIERWQKPWQGFVPTAIPRRHERPCLYTTR